jgi:Cu-processing system permease protein
MIVSRIAFAVISRLFRSRLLIVAVLISLVVMIMMAQPMISIAEMKEGGEFADAQDMASLDMQVSIGMMGWMANLVALFLGSTVIRQDIKEGTIFSVLSKPVSRLQYFIGSALGAAFCQCAVWCVFGAVWLWFIYSLEKSIQPLHLTVLCSEMLKSLLMLSLALAWSQKFSPWIAGLFALLTFGGGNLARRAVDCLNFIKIDPPEIVGKICSFPFPTFDKFDELSNQLGQTSLEPVALNWQAIHTLDYLALALLVAWLCFRKQDLTSNT